MLLTTQFDDLFLYVPGPMKVVHVTADGQYALLYQCGGLRTDNTCSQITIDVGGKDRGPLPDEVKAELEVFTKKLCIDMDAFTTIKQGGEKIRIIKAGRDNSQAANNGQK